MSFLKIILLLILSTIIGYSNICGEHQFKNTTTVYAVCVDWVNKKSFLPGINHLPDYQTLIWVNAKEGDVVKFVVDNKTYFREFTSSEYDKVAVLVLDGIDYQKLQSIVILEEKK